MSLLNSSPPTDRTPQSDHHVQFLVWDESPQPDQFMLYDALECLGLLIELVLLIADHNSTTWFNSIPGVGRVKLNQINK